MISTAYLERTASDISQRIGCLVLNNQTVGIKSIKLNGCVVSVITERVRGITQITSVKLLDERGNLITERMPDLDVVDDQILEFTFEFEVRGDIAL